MVKSWAQLIAGALLGLILVGCGAATGGGSGTGDNGDKVYPTTVILNDGQKVECVVFQSVQEGGIWCITSEQGG